MLAGKNRNTFLALLSSSRQHCKQGAFSSSSSNLDSSEHLPQYNSALLKPNLVHSSSESWFELTTAAKANATTANVLTTCK